jgi:hypothetical protein
MVPLQIKGYGSKPLVKPSFTQMWELAHAYLVYQKVTFCVRAIPYHFKKLLL